ncbi:protein phosphatase 2C domain-containing protein [Ammonicoccus fulvus]|uniref:Protein phosphatase 2C domain-containing protein n=1 Tax=Ammonicoccus fulvus TaxID=3138240 RepID=A0ABZ3FPR7_9ACTN
MTVAVCERCAAPLAPEAAFCEVCGGAVAATLPDELGDRLHFGQSPASWVAGVCDRGAARERNEDAMAMAAVEPAGSHAALVVCDGVTSAENSDVASLAAARAALAILAAPFSIGLGGTHSAQVAGRRTFERAVREAQQAVLRESERNVKAPGACTFVAAVVMGPLVWHSCIGDSRAYLIPDEGKPLLLTRDDSMAEMMIAAGMPRADAEDTPLAHTITRWLGADAPDLNPRATQIEVTSPGWLLVCSDGLWNYASAPQDLAQVVREAAEVFPKPLALAEALVQWANDQGGHDNITVALARVGD